MTALEIAGEMRREERKRKRNFCRVGTNIGFPLSTGGAAQEALAHRRGDHL